MIVFVWCVLKPWKNGVFFYIFTFSAIPFPFWSLSFSSLNVACACAGAGAGIGARSGLAGALLRVASPANTGRVPRAAAVGSARGRGQRRQPGGRPRASGLGQGRACTPPPAKSAAFHRRPRVAWRRRPPPAPPAVQRGVRPQWTLLPLHLARLQRRLLGAIMS